MATATKKSASATTDTLTELETKFWQSMVDQDTDVAMQLLAEPALMVSSHGVMKFDHAAYRKMAEQGAMVLTSFELSDFSVLLPDASTGILSYRVKQEVESRQDRRRTTQEMFDTSTWIRDGSSWRCVMHTETPAAPTNTAH